MFGRLILAAGALALYATQPADAQSKIRVGWCSKTFSVSMAPLAVAKKKGWFKDNNVEPEILSFPGSIDCMRSLATRDIAVALASVEPLAILSLQGVKAKVFFESYRRNIFGLAVKADSGIETIKDLKGQTIGVLSMGSVGVHLARSLIKSAGLSSDFDVRIVVTGEPPQTAALMRRGDIKALSQFDTYYTLIERAGIKLRRLEDPVTSKFPSNSWVALDEVIEKRRDDLVGFTRAYAMGTAYAIEHPREAIKATYEVYPQTRPTGMEPEEAVTFNMPLLQDRLRTWRLDDPAKDLWGKIDVETYRTYLEWLHETGIVNGVIDASAITTSALLADINAFDKMAVEAP